MHIGRPYILNTPSFLILFRSALFKAARLSAEGNPFSINGVSGATFTLISMKSGLVWLLQDTWSMSCNTQHELHQIQYREFWALLASFLQVHPLNMQSIYLYKFSGLYCCLLLSFTVTVRSHFGMCVTISLNGSISVTVAWGRNDHSTLGKQEMEPGWKLNWLLDGDGSVAAKD